jgi:hypothetical protein
MRQSKDFAVEVALLSRKILFEGETDSGDSLLGAHMMVMQNPDVVQYLEGVDFRNFGQQGNLGRYPIHFHLSSLCPRLARLKELNSRVQPTVYRHSRNERLDCV